MSYGPGLTERSLVTVRLFILRTSILFYIKISTKKVPSVTSKFLLIASWRKILAKKRDRRTSAILQETIAHFTEKKSKVKVEKKVKRFR